MQPIRIKPMNHTTDSDTKESVAENDIKLSKFKIHPFKQENDARIKTEIGNEYDGMTLSDAIDKILDQNFD